MAPDLVISRKGKLRNKIAVFMAIVGVVPLVVAALVTYYVVESSHRDDVAKVEASALAQARGEVQSFLQNGLLAQVSVEFPGGGDIFSTSSAPAQQYALDQALAALPFLQAESYVNLQGQVTASADRSHPAGSAAASSSLPDIASSAAFRSAKAGNQYVGPVYFTGGVPMIDFAAPVTNGSDETIGVITGTGSLAPLQAVIASSSIGTSGYLYLVDQKGEVVAGGGGTAAGGMFADAIGTPRAAEIPMVLRAIGGTDALTAAAQMRYRNIFGTSVVAAGASLAESGQYWGLVAEWPTSEADAVIDALLLRDAIILFGVLVFIIILSAVLAGIIVRPVKKLEQGTARVAQGKFDIGVNIATGDELQELGDSFNDMVQGLKQLEQLKDEFVFVAAHELRTPVAAMKGYLELILDGTTGTIPDGTRQYIEKVIASNKRLIQLVNDLLEVARSQAGRLTIKVAPTDLGPAIASTLDELKSLADEKQISLNYRAALADGAAVPQVLADADRVKEVVVNLVGNAIKYMGGAGTVTITHELVAAAPSITTDGRDLPAMLVTRIADTGLGISAEAQKHLFEKFYRVQTEKTRDIQGTGLGLFIVKEIIEKMGGTISVSSEEGKGSAFSFGLKVAG